MCNFMDSFKKLLSVLVMASACIGSSATMPKAWGCAVAMPPEARVQVAEESAVIVWDAARRVQHFIRRAQFVTDNSKADFGFLVPSPTAPSMAKADNAVFDRLDNAIKPEVITQERREFYFTWFSFRAPGFDTASGGIAAGSIAPGATAGRDVVEVVSAQRVAGYDAVVLKANDSTALANWLRRNGYTTQPELAAWLTPYIQAKWMITAFKIAKSRNDNNGVATSAVRMTFNTDRPFFPYREPANQRDAKAQHTPRLLRVFMLSEARMDGALGEAGQLAKWPATVPWSDQLDEGLRGDVAYKLALKPEQLPATMRLTTFDDRASPRPGIDDVYFSAATDQSRIVPPPIIRTRYIRTAVPIGIILSALMVCTVALMFIRSARHHRSW